jgi:ABC-type multidrug transport system fused ATPase/permease subunit
MRADASQCEQRSIIPYYVTVLRRILLGPNRLLFLLASTMHALGHALVALAAGAVAGAMAARWGGSGPQLGASEWNRSNGLLVDQAFFWSLVGLGVVFVKGATGVYASLVQGRVAGQVGACLRLELLDALLAVHRLRRPRHRDQGAACASAMAQDVAALTERVHEVEIGLKHGLLGGARAAAQLVPLAGVLVALSPRTAAVAGLALATFGALLARLRSGYRRAAARAGHERTRLLEAADESVRHAELWVSYGAEGKARSALKALGEAIAGGGARLDARAAALSGANEVLGAAALAAAIGASRADWLGPAADGRTLLAFAVAFWHTARCASLRTLGLSSRGQPMRTRSSGGSSVPRRTQRPRRGPRSRRRLALNRRTRSTQVARKRGPGRSPRSSFAGCDLRGGDALPCHCESSPGRSW